MKHSFYFYFKKFNQKYLNKCVYEYSIWIITYNIHGEGFKKYLPIYLQSQEFRKGGNSFLKNPRFGTYILDNLYR